LGPACQHATFTNPPAPSRPCAAGLTTPARGAGRGRTAQSARTPRTGACARGWTRPRERLKTHLPLHRASEAPPSRGLERHLPCPANGQGHGGLFLLELLAASIQKEQAGVARTPSHPPPLGVSSSTSAPSAPDWGKKRARRRRVAPDKGGAGSRTGAGTTSPPGRRRHAREAPCRAGGGKDVNQLGTRSRSRGGRPPA
jgi:hypothetical protein